MPTRVLRGGLLAFAGAIMSAAQAQTPLESCSVESPNRSAVAQCLQRSLQEADAAMTAALASTRQAIFTLESGATRQQSLKALSAAQKSFLEFRKANCAWHAARMPSGTDAGATAQDCMIRMTRERAEELGAKSSAAEALSQPALPTESASVMAWQGVEWKLARMVRDGKEVPLVPNSKITANFHAAGRVAGAASVNRYFGSYKASAEGRIEWSPPGFGATRMAGRPELMQQEALFLDTLSKVTTARMEGTRLILGSEDGSVELTFGR